MPGYDHLQLGIDVTGADQSASKVRQLNEAVRAGAEATLAAGRQTVASLGGIEKAFASATRESAAFIAHHPILIAGVTKGTYVLAQHATQIDNVANTWRALRLAMSPTAFTASTIGVGIAFEALIRNAERYAKINREIGLESARTGISFQDVLTKRTAGSIEGGNFNEVFSGKSVATIRELVVEYNKLADPVDKAAFAVKNFGANAEKAMPALRTSMLDSLDSAQQFAAGMNKLERESLERFSNRLDELPEALHRWGAALKDFLHTGVLQDLALGVAHISDTIGTAPTVNQIQGIDAPFQMPSFGQVAGQKASAEAINRALLMMRPVDSDTLRRSDAAIEAYRGTRESIQGKLESAESQRRKYLEQLPGARGTDLEQTVRAGILTAGKEIEGYKASIAAIEAKEKAVKDLESAERALVEFEKQMGEKSMSPIDRIFSQRDERVAAGGKGDVWSRATGAALMGALPELKRGWDAIDKETRAAFGKSDQYFEQEQKEFWDGVVAQANRGGTAAAGEFLDYLKRVRDVADAINDIQVDSERGDIMARSGRQLALANARFGPGQEGTSITFAYQERLRLAEQLYDFEYSHARTLVDQERQERAFADYKRANRDAEIEHEVRLAELQRRRIEEFRGEMGGLFDAILGGKSGIQQFALGQVKNVGRAVFSNTMTSLATGGAITRQSTFAGAGILGDALGGANPLKTATDINTAATIANTQALTRMALSASGGGGGYVGGAGSILSGIFGGGADAPPTDYLGGGDWGDGTILPMKNGGTNWGKTAGYAGAIAAGGFGIYSGIRSGGGAGALTAAGSALAMAGTIISLSSKALSIAGPIGMLAGMGLGALTSFIPNPKEQRAKEIDAMLESSRYTAPSATTYTSDRFGRGFDYNTRGEIRIVLETPIHVDAMNSKSFNDHSVDIAGAVVTALSNRLPELETHIRNIAHRR